MGALVETFGAETRAMRRSRRAAAGSCAGRRTGLRPSAVAASSEVG